MSSPDAATRHAIGRALVRLNGAAAAGLDPRSLRVVVTDEGKPNLAGVCDVHVSVAHTGRVVVVAISVDTPVGVDIEEATREMTTDPMRIAQRLFNQAEIASLQKLPADAVASWFLSAWTIKEAVGKALGVGVTPALSGTIVEGESSLVLRHVWCDPPAESWTVHELNAPDGNEKIAVALPAPAIQMAPVRQLDLRRFRTETDHNQLP